MINFTPRCNQLIEQAKSEAISLGHSSVQLEHLFVAFVKVNKGVGATLLSKTGLDFAKIIEETVKESGKMNRQPSAAGGDVVYSDSFSKCLSIADGLSKKMDQLFVSSEHILLAILEFENEVPFRVLNSLNVKTRELKQAIWNTLKSDDETPVADDSKAVSVSSSNKPASTTNTKVLEKYGTNLNLRSQSSDSEPVIGRKSEIDRLIHVLGRKRKNNPCLIGHAGVGKTAIVEGLAKKIVAGEVPEYLLSKEIFVIDLSLMIAGTRFRGQFEERLKELMKEVKDAEGKIIVFFDEIHTIVGAGSGEGSMDAGNILKPALARGEFPCIGATTFDEYKKNIESDPALERRFQPVKVDEPDTEATYEILLGLRKCYEKFHNVRYTNSALRLAAVLSEKFVTDRRSPDKAIDVIDEAGALVKLTPNKSKKKVIKNLAQLNLELYQAVENQQYDDVSRLRSEIDVMINSVHADDNCGALLVTDKSVRTIISNWTGVPVTDLSVSGKLALQNIATDIKSVIVGQDSAIDVVVSKLKKHQTPFHNPDKPIGSFLLVGPTGVGKTYLSQMVALKMFGSKNKMIRFDMSEFKNEIDVNKFIGSPAGYVGYEEGGRLVNLVRQNPYSVLLFDEIEKAHPQILQVFLQILSDGVLVDGLGRKADFKNTVIFFTSNAKANMGVSKTFAGFGEPVSADDANDLTKKYGSYFEAEFLNRLDSIVELQPLTKETCKKVSELELKKLRSRLLAQKIKLVWTNEVVYFVTDKGYSDKFGAREIQRAVSVYVEEPLTNAFLDNKLSFGKSGGSINLTVNNNKIEF